MMNILPEFESRQVLTSDELNWLTCYLDSQNRQTRKLLIGCGVVGGLQVLLNKTSNSIQLTNGCALTSAGHIVSVDKVSNSNTTTFTRIKKYAQKDKELLSFPYLSDENELEKDYSKSVNTTSIYFSEFKDDVLELFEETYNDAEHLKANQVEGKVALAFAEIIQTELKDCEEDNCQDRGKKYTFITKILLISEADALNLLRLQFQLASGDANAIGKSAFPWLYVPNLNILKPIFSNLNTASGLNEVKIIGEYNRCIDVLGKTLKDNGEAFEDGLNRLNKFVSIKPNSFDFVGIMLELIEKYKSNSNSSTIFDTQIFYDYLWTIVKAYQEIQLTAQGLRAKCLIEQSAFPNHVLLGKLGLVLEDFGATIAHTDEVFRHPFYSQYTQTEQALVCRKITFLFNRLQGLLKTFDKETIIKNKAVKLTPGASIFESLSMQAIPYYLNSAIKSNWNENAAQPYLKQNNTYYFNADSPNAGRPNGENIYNKQPLAYQGNNDFFRVEGVHGQAALTALNNVFQIRKNFGLPYEVIMLRLNEDAPENYTFNFSVNEDIESIYQVIRAELLKQINLNTNYLGNLRFKEGKYDEMKKTLSANLEKYYNINAVKAKGTQRAKATQPNSDKYGFTQTSDLVDNLQFKSTLLYSQAKTKLSIQKFNFFPIFQFAIFHIDSLASLIDELKNDDKFKAKSSLSFYTNLLAIAKANTANASNLFYKTLRLYAALRLQELALRENFLEFDVETYVDNLEDELMDACDAIIPFLKNANSDFIKSDAVLTEVVKGEMLDYADRIKFDDDWVKMIQIDAENKKRNGGLGVENLLDRFVQFHPGISHGCGVPKGGTYIMVYNKSNIVTADFYLPYILSSQLRPIQYTLLENKTITLSGTIYDVNGVPIAGARVKIGENTVLTNSKGEYVGLVSSNTSLTVVVSAEGFKETSKEIEIATESLELDLTLEKGKQLNTVTVKFIDEREELLALDIKLEDNEKKEKLAIDGVLILTGNPGDKFAFRVVDERFESKKFDVTIKEEDYTINVNLIAISTKTALKVKVEITNGVFDGSKLRGFALATGKSLEMKSTGLGLFDSLDLFDQSNSFNLTATYNGESKSQSVNSGKLNTFQFTVAQDPVRYKKATWLTTDLHIDPKVMDQLEVKFNGTLININNGIQTKELDLNYDQKTLTIQGNGDKAMKFTTGSIPFEDIESVIVLLKDVDNQKVTRNPTIKQANLKSNSELFTFVKDFSEKEIGRLIAYHAGFNNIPKETLKLKNYYCFLIPTTEIETLTKQFNL